MSRTSEHSRLVLTRLLVVLACWLSWASVAQAQTPFYIARPNELPGPPGSLIRFQMMAGTPAGGMTYRVLYRSTGLAGEPVAVSGVVIVPAESAPVGGRPIIAWAHPTTGVVPRCAPSLSPFLFPLIPGLRSMLAAGYVVAATDYPGLGTPGPHPYLVGISEGRAVLDSVRAARALPSAAGSNRYAVWGHSQGGHAALYAGILAHQYAPELKLVGIAAAAPATDLGTLFRDDFGTSGGKNLTSMALWSWSRVFGADMSRVVAPAALPKVEQLAQECVGSIPDFFQRRAADAFLETVFLDVGDLTTVAPWRGIMNANSPGSLPPQIPILLAQGTADTVVRPGVTYGYKDVLCRGGSKVQLVQLPGIGHGFVGYRSADVTLRWIAERFAGAPAPGNCPDDRS